MKILISALLFSSYLMACSPNQSNPKQNKTQTVQLNSTEVKAFAKLNNSVFLDVRTDQEFNQGHIEKALHLNFYDPNFAANVNKLDKNKSYIVYCKSGVRSAKASSIMRNLGFKNTANLVGGFMAWKP